MQGRGTSDYLNIKSQTTVTRDTIARWAKKIMIRAGIHDTWHSARAAVVSKAKFNGVAMTEILARAGWTRESTIIRKYRK